MTIYPELNFIYPYFILKIKGKLLDWSRSLSSTLHLEGSEHAPDSCMTVITDYAALLLYIKIKNAPQYNMNLK